MSKIANVATTNSSNVQKQKSDEKFWKEKKSEQKKSVSTSKGPSNANGHTSPAFQGAKFNKYGYCLKHSSVQLVKPMKGDAGMVVYQELHQFCSSCQADRNRSKKSTSLGGGKVYTSHRVHGARSRSKSRERGHNGQETSSRTRTRSNGRSKPGDTKPRREYDTPFDGKGRCHYHTNVQLATKKMTGGWKVLQSACPKCMESKFKNTGGGSGAGGGDDQSVRSSSSRKSTCSGTNGGGDALGQHDKNGCCVLHPHIQVAKKKLLGGGWKVVRDCPNCGGGDVGADDYSVKSGRSARSASSRKSSRSVKTGASHGKPGKATKSGRYGALPFDADGYCCRHPNVQLAKKKTLGGFKIMHSVCPECMLDGSGDGRRKVPRRKSQGTGRVFDDSGSDKSSMSGSPSARKKRIRVRNLKTEDEEGKHGRYSGYVNDDHQPHGDGTMEYTDGTVYDGVWSEGSKVHGKTTKKKGK